MDYSMGPTAEQPSGRGMPPDELSALAVRLSRLAGEMDTAGARLAAATTLEWRSKSAEAFRREADVRAADLAASSSKVREASDHAAAYARALEARAAQGSAMFGG